MVGQRWPADGGPTSASNGNVPPASHRLTGGGPLHGGNLPFIATGGPTASCYLGIKHCGPTKIATQCQEDPGPGGGGGR